MVFKNNPLILINELSAGWEIPEIITIPNNDNSINLTTSSKSFDKSSVLVIIENLDIKDCTLV
jgi:hypothetical protein